MRIGVEEQILPAQVSVSFVLGATRLRPSTRGGGVGPIMDSNELSLYEKVSG